MIVLHAAPLPGNEHSGPNQSVPGLAGAQARLAGTRIAILNTLGGASMPPTAVAAFPSTAIEGSPGLCGLPAPWNRPDLVVFHSTYIPLHARLARWLRQQDIPYIVCPRGGMTHGARSQKRWKKRAGDLLFFRRLVRGAAAIQCLTADEARATVAWHRPKFIAGNGVSLPAAAEQAPVGSRDTLQFTWIGRMDIRHKGLDLLLDACRRTGDALKQARAQVCLRGSDWLGSRQVLQGRVCQWDLQSVVTVGDAVAGAEKQELLASSDVFLHPSRWEGQPMAVLEAAARGLPSLLTPGTNLADEMASFGAAWRVDGSPETLAQALRALVGIERTRLAAMGQRARQYAAERSNWADIARRSLDHYARYTRRWMPTATESKRAA